jgi:protein-L-isoaspartate(D-aspartate) O-methyltransferase
MIKRLQEQGICNQDVLDAIKATPRHIFLDEALSHRAYEDSSLPIGYNQTLSQPYIVARMTEILVSGGPLKRVLEIGTGSGYQSSILAQLVERLYSVERIKPLQEKARERLKLLGLRNVQLKHADGGFGWADMGPFDGILSAAAPSRIPQELLDQLALGGRLIIPVGDEVQELHLVTRTEEGYQTQIIEPVKFVPMRPGTVR